MLIYVDFAGDAQDIDRVLMFLRLYILSMFSKNLHLVLDGVSVCAIC